jgi:hypothetical protein
VVLVHIDRRLLDWGVFLILLGGIPLAVSQGWIPDDIQWWDLWPLILVGLGVSLILRWTPAAPFAGVLLAATFGVLGGGLLANGINGVPVVNVGCAGSTYGTEFTAQQGELTSDRVDVVLDSRCGDLDVSTAAGTAWALSGVSAGGKVPDVTASNGRLEIRSPDAQDLGGFFEDKSRWSVTVPTGPPMGMSATVNAGSGTLDLAGTTIDRLDVTLNAGDVTIDVGQAVVERTGLTVNAGSAKLTLPDGSMTGSITVNAGSVAMCAPTDVALRLTTNNQITASYDYARGGLQQVSDDVWQSPDWASATKRIEMSTTANAGSISLDPEGGCR